MVLFLNNLRHPFVEFLRELEFISLTRPHNTRDLHRLSKRGRLVASVRTSSNRFSVPSEKNFELGDLFSGVKIFEKVTLESILTDGKSITGVETNRGPIKCEILVNCGGQVMNGIFLLK